MKQQLFFVIDHTHYYL